MASTRLLNKPPFFLSLLTMMLLSATQGVSSYGRAISEGDGIWICHPDMDSFSENRATRISFSNILATSGLYNEDESVVSPELMQQWKELYAKIREEEKMVQNLFRDATNAQFKAGTQLRSAELKKDMTDPVLLATLQTAFDKSVADLKKVNLQQKEIKKLVEKARKINAKPGSITEKKVSGLLTTYNDYLARYKPDQAPLANPVVSIPASAPPPVPPVAQTVPPTQTKPTAQAEPTTPTKPTSQTQTSTKPKTKTQAKPKVEETKPNQERIEVEPPPYDPEMINKRPGQSKSFRYLAQPFQCIFEIDTFDRATNMSLKALKPGVLFTHTDPDLKPYFRGKDLITCLGRVSKSGSYVQLTIEFQIASSHSQSNFGSLEEGSLLRFKLMNDEYISLFNLKTNMGHIDPYTGYTIFSGQYALGKQEINKLSTLELDKMRVMWSTGFEDYDVSHVDFLINQLTCLISK